MARPEGGLRQSLQFRLSARLALAIALIGALCAAYSYHAAFAEAIELQDQQLLQTASLLATQHGIVLSPDNATKDDIDPEARIVVQLIGAAGNANVHGPLAGLPSHLPDGLQTVKVDGETWRIDVRTVDAATRIAVAQSTEVRDETARDNAKQMIAAFLLLIPLLVLLIQDVVRRTLRPLSVMAEELAARAGDDLRPLPAKPLPSEISPFTESINHLLARVRHAIGQQRRFVADAAHELRSPLTALSVQAERLDACEMPADARDKLGLLRESISRTRGLLEQLLSLARVQQEREPAPQSASLLHAVKRVLEDLLPLADAKSIDIGVVTEDDAKVPVREADLQTLVKNLVDNAIRYTPRKAVSTSRSCLRAST
ncbi:MAG: two-component sensor histidine kinase [Burkholderiales bacterium]|nr:two-component sensor histidine kinase [Burkholderiales bacterium]